MSANGRMARECSKFYSRLSKMIAEKWDQPYSVIASWIRRKISFSLIRSIGMCIRGSRSVTSSNDLLTSTRNDAVASEVISNTVSVWIYEHFSPFFCFFFYLKFVIGKNFWLLRQEEKHPTGWTNVSGKKKRNMNIYGMGCWDWLSNVTALWGMPNTIDSCRPFHANGLSEYSLKISGNFLIFLGF